LPQFELLQTPLRVGLVADTHRSSRNARALPQTLLRGLEGCDLILHAGDVNAPWVLRELELLAPVRAVRGNNEELPLAEDLPLELYFQAGDVKLGLMHGHHHRMTARQYTLDQMRGVVDCAMYGHSHVPEVAEHEGLLMVNPGSPTQKRYQPNATFAIVTVRDMVEARLLIVD
jgi:uncharacterized protein